MFFYSQGSSKPKYNVFPNVAERGGHKVILCLRYYDAKPKTSGTLDYTLPYTLIHTSSHIHSPICDHASSQCIIVVSHLPGILFVTGVTHVITYNHTYSVIQAYM